MATELLPLEDMEAVVSKAIPPPESIIDPLSHDKRGKTSYEGKREVIDQATNPVDQN